MLGVFLLLIFVCVFWSIVGGAIKGTINVASSIVDSQRIEGEDSDKPKDPNAPKTYGKAIQSEVKNK